MTRLNPDTRAVVAAFDRLTTQARRIADALTLTYDGTPDDGSTTPDDGPCAQHPTAPVIGGMCGGCTQYPADMRPAPAADDDQAQRWARREPLLVLLTRVQRGRTLTADEATLLRQHVEAEMRDADTAHAVAWGNLRHVQTIVPEIDRLAAELEQAQAAIKRVRAECAALTAETEHTHYEADNGIREAVRRVLAALDGTEQPTTKE
ncbi:hypothetical protein ACF06Q_09375 [Streptomyces leeuwenhoekii]|uniref:hypothetical protein n=1 Tax=Streptomyces leeuwenhoekii TaxID=1437453 RepID=UPI0036F6F182